MQPTRRELLIGAITAALVPEVVKARTPVPMQVRMTDLVAGLRPRPQRTCFEYMAFQRLDPMQQRLVEVDVAPKGGSFVWTQILQHQGTWAHSDGSTEYDSLRSPVELFPGQPIRLMASNWTEHQVDAYCSIIGFMLYHRPKSISS